MSRRATAAAITAAALVVLAITVLAVPVTRAGLADAWCRATGQGCTPAPPVGRAPGGAQDWRLLLDPVEAATWGHYAALGDSYSSGDGAGDYLDDTTGDEGCWRSANAYPSLTADSFDFAGAFAFEACSKQKAADLLGEDGAESQLSRITEYTSLVTLGVGGNDLGFTPVLRTCMVRMPLVSGGVCQGQEDDIQNRMDSFDGALDDILAEVRGQAPDARILLVGYPRLFPEKPPGMYYTLTAEDQQWLNTVVERFNGRLQDAAAEADAELSATGDTGSVEFADVYDALDGHEVSVEDGSWLNGVVLRDLREGIRVDRSSFHPNAAGQLAFSAHLEQQIRSGPDRDLFAARERVAGAEPDVLARDVE